MKLPSIKRPQVPPDERIPRGAIAVVLVGLLGTIAAALLTTGKGEGEFAHLEFVQQAKVADSRSVAVPGSSAAKMQLIKGSIQATGTNVAKYSLFRVLNTLKIDAGAAIGDGKIICSTHVPTRGTLIAQTHGALRATYPRSSEGLYGQGIEPTALIKFASHGLEYAVLEFTDLPAHWTTIEGVKVNWPEYEEGTENVEYGLPAGKLKQTLELPFSTIWKSQKVPMASMACTLKVAAGQATVETEGRLKHVSAAIDEEAEELKQEERAEAEEAAEEASEEGE